MIEKSKATSYVPKLSTTGAPITFYNWNSSKIADYNYDIEETKKPLNPNKA